MAEPILRIGVDTNAFRRGLDDLRLKQFPFAFAKTLTDSAKSGQQAAKQQTRKVFELHGDFIPNNIVITPARVSDFKYGIASAEVRTTEKIAFMTWHEYGGTKKPQGAALAIPTFKAQKLIPDLRNRTGRIRPKYLPKTLLKKWNERERGGKGSVTLSAYITAGMIFARIRNRFRTTGSKEGFPVFALAQQAHIRPQWHFARVIQVRVESVILRHFTRNMEYALATVRQ